MECECKCGRTFSTKNSLKSHARFCDKYIAKPKTSVYLIGNEYVCECGKTFEKYQSINAHFSFCLIHRKGKPAKTKRGKFKLTAEHRKKASETFRKKVLAGEAKYSFTGRKHTIESRAKISAKANEKNNGYVRTKYYELFCKSMNKIVKLQGTWELEFAKRLDELGIEWKRDRSLNLQYEFDNVKRRYFPDFYLPEIDTFVEIKGHWFKSADGRVDDRRKMDLVKSYNPHVSIIILDSLKSICEFVCLDAKMKGIAQV